ncbi:MAG: DUF6141 family protein [Terriglobia bacterium]
MRQPGSVAVPFFVEEQRARQLWLWLILLPSMAILWIGFYYQIIRGVPFGKNPGPDWVWWVSAPLVGVGLPWLLYSARMLTEVYGHGVVVRFTTGLFPLYRKTIPVEQIKSAEARTYRPLREFGGWGVRRGWGKRGWAYSVSGNRGVQLTLANGKGILLGSHDPERLALAIQRVLSSHDS